MVYIFESELSKNKSIFFALTRVYGIGNSTAHSICHKLGFSKNLKVKHLSISQTQELVLKIEALNLLLTSDLKKFKFLKRKSLITNKSYWGLRWEQGLPIWGQWTHTNARTARKWN